MTQYVQFCKISDAQRKLYGPTQEAIEKTIQICKERNVLAPFLTSREKEVTTIMATLYNQETIQEIREYNLVKDANEKSIQFLVESIGQLLSGHENVTDEIVKRLMVGYGLSADEAKAKTKQYLPQN